MDHVNQEMDKIVNELNVIKTELSKMDQNKLVTEDDLKQIRVRLGRIDSRRFRGSFDIGGKLFEWGSHLVNDLIDECHTLVSEYLTKGDYYKVSKQMRPIHDRLVQVILCLKDMQERKDYQPHDLLPYRRFLGELDFVYHDGAFDLSADPTDHSPNYPEGQAIVCGLFNEAHEMIRQMLMETPTYAIADDLLPVYDKLKTINAALEATKKDTLAMKDRQSYDDRIKNINQMFVSVLVKGGTKEGISTVATELEKAQQLYKNLTTVS